MQQDQSHDNPVDSFILLNITMKGNPTPSVDLGLIPFIPSREQVVANIDTIFFDLDKKIIVRRKEKRMKMGEKPMVVMVTEVTVMHKTDEDP